MEFMKTVSLRRSHREFAGDSMSEQELRDLLQIATMAPNHRRNQPWRFSVVLHQQLPKFWLRLEEVAKLAFAGREPEEAQKKVRKLAKTLPTLGALVYVTSLKDVHPMVEQENYAAACCAIQNLLLAATDRSLGSFWSTGSAFAHTGCMEILGIAPAEQIFVGAIWLGKALDNPPPPKYELEERVRFWGKSPKAGQI